MKRLLSRTLLTLILALWVLPGLAGASDDLQDITNFQRYSKTLASSGQPDSQQLQQLAEQGVERIIYLAYSDNDSAIVAEDRKVLELGMDYVHIPVHYAKPTLADFQYMAAVLQIQPDKHTLIHCQINYRASVFSFLYRIVFLGTPVSEALADMQQVWQPYGVWLDYIHQVAGHYDINLDCDQCNWRTAN